MTVYLLYKGEEPELACGIPDVWALGLKLWFQFELCRRKELWCYPAQWGENG
jgi:hypothetical protein